MGGVGFGKAFQIFIFLSFFFPLKTISKNNSSSSKALCIEMEREALLKFKKELQDPSNRLSSWTPEIDCCKWVGIRCSSLTGHVKELNLSNSQYDEYSKGEGESVAIEGSRLKGNLSDSILNLKHIKFIDLSYNDFGGIEIPSFLGSLVSLNYLILKYSRFQGLIPHQLGNLSNLQQLDLQGNYNLYSENLYWIQSLSSLAYLDLSDTNLSNVSDWVLNVNKLPFLKELHLVGCRLNHITPLNQVNFTSLLILDISINHFDGRFIPKWISKLGNLVSLDLSMCNFQGPLPRGFSNLTSLENLDLGANHLNSSLPKWLFSLTSISSLRLGSNHFEGSISCAIQNLSALTYLDLSRNNYFNSTTIPSCIYSLRNLRYLDLSYLHLQEQISNDIANLTNLVTLYLEGNELVGNIPRSIGSLYSLRFISLSDNKMSGLIPKNIGNLSSLEYLDLSSNRFEGIISEVHFANLRSLNTLLMSGNNLTLSFSVGWTPPFDLYSIILRSCNLGPQFPKWLKSQKNFIDIDLSNAKISDTVPEWFWNLSTSYEYLNLSHNQLSGKIPDFHLNFDFILISLYSNKFHGNLPRISSNILHFDLSNNFFDGNMSNFLCHSISQNNQLMILDLGDNLLSGNIPNCWTKWMSLIFVSLGSNNLSGKLPSSMESLFNLQSLHLRNNSLFGNIPRSLKNCSNLITLDLGINSFHGNIPTWIGTNLPNLMFLGLRSNQFSGLIPNELCHLSSLQIMDIGSNNFNGSIPHCFGNFTAMATKHGLSGNSLLFYPYFTSLFDVGILLEKAFVITKGEEFQYDKILRFMTSLDLSDNNLSGEIPREMFNLFELKSLNLSGNNLRGSIPQQIGSMINMESLDLSRNQLSGQIPQSISKLTYLSYLNLSYNHLLGPIPTSTQLQSFNPSSFIGNELLCGQPLPNSCSIDKTTSNTENEDDAKYIDHWFYLSVAIGFVVGFWGIWGPLLISTTWRHTYFRYVNSLLHKFN